MEYNTLSPETFKDLESRILYEDNHILIVNKKCGEITQGDKTGDTPLSETYKAFIALRDSKPGKVFLGVPHRLDRPVAGALILAKTSKALERLTAMFRDGEVHKTYWALLCKDPQKPEGMLEDLLFRNEKLNKTFVCDRPRKDAKLAKLSYKVIDHTDRYTIAEIRLYTGRHHQIRCQLSNMGCPIKGDLKYGAPRSNPDGGISLLARHIEFIHPVKRTPVSISAPVPCSWKGVSPDLAHPCNPDTTPQE